MRETEAFERTDLVDTGVWVRLDFGRQRQQQRRAAPGIYVRPIVMPYKAMGYIVTAYIVMAYIRRLPKKRNGEKVATFERLFWS